MDPVSIGLLIAQTLIIHGPEIAADVATLLHSADPTLAQWLAVLNKAKGQVNADGSITLVTPTIAAAAPTA